VATFHPQERLTPIYNINESYLSIILLKHKTKNIKLKNDEQKMLPLSCRFADGAFKPGAAI
jgi:hypothetical protein